MHANSRFLIYECLSPSLAEITKEDYGYAAMHVTWLGKPPRNQKSWKDPDIVDKVIDQNYILVTNNRKDFVGRYYRERSAEIHSGLVIILEKTDFEGEKRAFRAAMKLIVTLDDTVNKLIEVDGQGRVTVSDWPDFEAPSPWAAGT